MAGEHYREAKTPSELYQFVELDWYILSRTRVSVENASLVFQAMDQAQQAAQQAALRLCAENADKNLPPVPNTGAFVVLLNWCIEAQKCFAQAPGEKAPTVEGRKAETPTGNGDADRDERMARVLIYVRKNPGEPERAVEKGTGVAASTFRGWTEYQSLRKMLAAKVVKLPPRRRQGKVAGGDYVDYEDDENDQD